jgi:hypothetical protein
MGFHSFVNTRYFSEAAIAWKKNGGKYTTAPRGSRDYLEFWKEEDKRCIEGYSVGGLWIPGKYYGYLNYFPMARVPEHVLLKALAERRNSRGVLSQATADKTVAFPSFWEIDYEWWNFKHIAWYGGNFMGINSPGGKHMCVLKTRGAGFSYKEAWDGVYNFTFRDGSKSYYFSGMESFLVGDAIMDKVQAGLDWINEYSPYWKKNRKVKNTLMHQKASYLDSMGVERGTFSEIIGQIVDKPSKTRGKRGIKASFEEAGSFPHLEKALRVALGSMSEGGNVYVGQVTVFGTGGETGPGIQGLDNIFGSPDTWDMLAFPNIWEKGMQHTECGLFVPCYRANSFFMDEDGNVDITGAIAADDIMRRKALKSGKPRDLDDRKAEYSRTPAEALQRITANGFNIAELDKQINLIRTSKAVQGMIRHGDLVRTSKTLSGVEFVPKPKHLAKPIEDYPHNPSDDLTGCVSIVQPPFTDIKGHVPKDMYLITIDPYYKEQSEELVSLFSLKVWKMDNEFDNTFVDLPVAWYAGRPKSLDDNHEILFMLADLYNAEIQGEISGGGQAVVNYARLIRKLHKLRNEPDMVHNKELASKSAGNSFLMNMSTTRKAQGIIYLEDWHIKPRGVDQNGNFILNVHHIYDIAFLREMRKHDPANKKQNCDRISDAIIAMYELKERATEVFMRKKQRERAAKESFYDRELYGAEGTYDNEEETVTAAY